MKKILIINGHPDPESYNNALFEAYKHGAESSGFEVDTIIINDLQFQSNLSYGYRQRTELEPDLIKAREQILWADHLVWIFPVWWGGPPAILKGFLDRIFLPGYAFNKREGSLWWDKLLTGKSARVINTLDQPAWYYRWINGRPTYYSFKKMTLNFVGIKPVKVTPIGPIRLSKDSYRKNWLNKVERLGKKGV